MVRSDGLAPYLGNAERGTREAKAFRVLAPTFTTLVYEQRIELICNENEAFLIVWNSE